MSYLATVTLEVEVLVESHHSDCLFAAWGRNNGLITAHTQRGETPGTEEVESCTSVTFLHTVMFKVKEHQKQYILMKPNSLCYF